MPRRNLSARINALVDNQVMYRDMTLGSIVHITALDAKVLTEKTVRVQAVAITEEEADKHRAIFRFLDDNFHFFDGRNQPVAIRAGTLAESGISATLYPQMVMSMVMTGGIGIGRDYSFEMVGGKDVTLVVHGIKDIRVEDPPVGWKAPSLSRYTTKVRAIRQREQEEETAKRIFLQQGLRVRTKNSTYFLTPADEDYGPRTLRKEGGESYEGRLIHAEVNGCMVFEIFANGQTLASSTVEEIIPWSEDQENEE